MRFKSSAIFASSRIMSWYSSFCIAFCLMQKSGTGFTLRNAENVGIEIVNIADEIY